MDINIFHILNSGYDEEDEPKKRKKKVKKKSKRQTDKLTPSEKEDLEIAEYLGDADYPRGWGTRRGSE